MTLLTTAQVIAQMQAYLAANRPDISTQEGSVVEDVVIESPAQQFGQVYTTLQQTQELQSFEFSTDMTTVQLDALASNYGLMRLPGTSSTSIVTFRIRNYNFGSSTINISAGTVVSTISTTTVPAVAFTTSSALVFLPSLAPSYFNPVSGFYEQSVSVSSVSIGVSNNVGAGTITQLVTSVPGIDAVINNVAATGGTDQESNPEFAQRAILKLSGNNVGTPNGILSLVEATSGVVQAVIVGPNDPEMLRSQFGGSVDVYIEGQTLTEEIDTPTYTTTGPQQFVLNFQPVVSASSVSGIVNSVPYTFAQGPDYSVNINPNILFSGSVDAASYISFNTSTAFTITSVVPSNTINVNTTSGMAEGDTIFQGSFSTTITAPVISLTQITVGSTTGFTAGTATFTGVKPDNNTQLSITYTYDSLVASIQTTLDSPSNLLVASDILVKEASEAEITVTAGITIVPGFMGASVVSSVQTALTNYINALGLGSNIPLSELVVVIQSVSGVDDVDLSSLSVSSSINDVVTTVPPGQVLIVSKTAFPVAFALNITVES